MVAFVVLALSLAWLSPNALAQQKEEQDSGPPAVYRDRQLGIEFRYPSACRTVRKEENRQMRLSLVPGDKKTRPETCALSITLAPEGNFQQTAERSGFTRDPAGGWKIAEGASGGADKAADIRGPGWRGLQAETTCRFREKGAYAGQGECQVGFAVSDTGRAIEFEMQPGDAAGPLAQLFPHSLRFMPSSSRR